MSLRINIEITVSEDQAYTEREAAIISAMQAHPAGGARTAPAAPTAPAAKAEAKAAATPVTHAKDRPAAPAPKVEKPAPATTSSTSGKAAVLDTTLDEAPEPAEEEEDLLGGDNVIVAEYTLEDAVAAATKLVSSGKAAQVKAALASAGGAKKVSDLKPENIGDFMTALKG